MDAGGRSELIKAIKAILSGSSVEGPARGPTESKRSNQSNRFFESDARLSFKRAANATAPSASVPPHPAFGVGRVEARQRARGSANRPAIAGFKCQRTIMETGPARNASRSDAGGDVRPDSGKGSVAAKRRKGRKRGRVTGILVLRASGS